MPTQSKIGRATARIMNEFSQTPIQFTCTVIGFLITIYVSFFQPWLAVVGVQSSAANLDASAGVIIRAMQLDIALRLAAVAFCQSVIATLRTSFQIRLFSTSRGIGMITGIIITLPFAWLSLTSMEAIYLRGQDFFIRTNGLTNLTDGGQPIPTYINVHNFLSVLAITALLMSDLFCTIIEFADYETNIELIYGVYCAFLVSLFITAVAGLA
jgi:hypothetical protein